MDNLTTHVEPDFMGDELPTTFTYLGLELSLDPNSGETPTWRSQINSCPFISVGRDGRSQWFAICTLSFHSVSARNCLTSSQARHELSEKLRLLLGEIQTLNFAGHR